MSFEYQVGLNKLQEILVMPLSRNQRRDYEFQQQCYIYALLDEDVTAVIDHLFWIEDYKEKKERGEL